MTRRTRMGPLQTLGRGVDRMAPGGRRSAAESPIRPFNRPVGEAGEDAPGGACTPLVADPDGYTFRPAAGLLLDGLPSDWFYTSSAILVATLSVTAVRTEGGTGAGAGAVLWVNGDGPYAAGDDVGHGWVQNDVPGYGPWEWLRFSTGSVGSGDYTHLTSSDVTDVRWCYSPTYPPTFPGAPTSWSM